jgi:hypothetical protein
VNAQLHISDRLALTGGFRAFSMKTETDKRFIRFQNRGGYAGVELSL